MRQSIDMYRATKTWQPNRYMRLLVSDGIIYFFVRSIYDIRTVLAYETDAVLSYKLTLAMDTETFILLFSMFPRFIIGIRELYDRDRHRQWQGVDTGFGVFSYPAAVEDAMVSGIAFADPLLCRGTQDVEELGGLNVEMKLCEVNRGDTVSMTEHFTEDEGRTRLQNSNWPVL